MEILFLVPPADLEKNRLSVDRVYGCNYGYDYKPPLHLLVLATIAKQRGHSVELLDCPAQGYTRRKFSRYLAEHPRIGMVVFFSVWLSGTEDLLAAAMVAANNPSAVFVFCGSYPSWKAELFLQGTNYFVLRGEPERSFEHLLVRCENGGGTLEAIPGLSFISGNCRRDIPSGELCDIDSLPIPDRTLLHGTYFFNRLCRYPATVMCVSRGCSYRCSYCAPHSLDQAIEIEYARDHGCRPPLRLRGVGAVIEEFRQIAAAGYRSVELCDNQFPWEPERTKEICRALIPLKLRWICYARADHLRDREMVELMKRAGCQMVYVGTESYCQEILDDMKKDVQVEDNYAAVRMLTSCGIEAEVSVLAGGSALESPATVTRSVREACRQNTHFIHFSIAQPLPNTELFRRAREKGWLREEQFSPSDNTQNALLRLPLISDVSLKRIIRVLYLRHYLSARFIVRQLCRMSSPQQFGFMVKAAARFFRVFMAEKKR